MRKIFNRILWTLLLILLQIAWLALLFIKLIDYFTVITIVLKLISFALVVYLIGKNGNAEIRMGWIIMIMIFPLFGGLLYLSFGDKMPSRRMRRKLNLEHDELRLFMPQDEELIKDFRKEDNRAAQTFEYITRFSSYPVCKNTSVKYYPVGEKMVADILDAIEKAEVYIFLEYFIIEEGKLWNTILDQLVKKAAEGVEVRIIYDDIGCVATLPPHYDLFVESLGKNIHCMAFNPFVPLVSLVMNNRDHKKIIVVDGKVAFNGGINLADEYINEVEKYGYWKDTAVRLEGPAVWNFTIMFLETWRAYRKDKYEIEYFLPEYEKMNLVDNGYVQPFCDTPLENEPIAENVYIELLNQAEKYVYIFTPYLIIDNDLRSALCMSAKRGVDVRIVTPGIPDKKIVNRLTKSNYRPLLEAGVKIYEYTPGFIHAKSYVCDDKFALVGTINMDYRSLYMHFECGTFMYNTASVDVIKEDCLDVFKKSYRITLENRKQTLIGIVFDSILRLISPLM